jgi:DNA-directed RNA polymerase subunit RPC12/RpoP
MFMVLFLYHFGMTSYSCSSCKEGNKQMSLGRG